MRFAKLKDRRVAALRHINKDGIVLALGVVVLAQAAAQPASLDPHRCVDRRIVILIPPQHVDCNRIFFGSVAAKRILDCIAQKGPAAFCQVEGFRAKNMVELLLNL